MSRSWRFSRTAWKLRTYQTASTPPALHLPSCVVDLETVERLCERVVAMAVKGTAELSSVFCNGTTFYSRSTRQALVDARCHSIVSLIRCLTDSAALLFHCRLTHLNRPRWSGCHSRRSSWPVSCILAADHRTCWLVGCCTCSRQDYRADADAQQVLYAVVIGHMTIWYPYVISYWWSFGMESVSPAVVEILHSKRIVVKSLTFQGHVTSSVTWPFDSPYTIPIGGPLEPILYL